MYAGRMGAIGRMTKPRVADGMSAIIPDLMILVYDRAIKEAGEQLKYKTCNESPMLGYFSAQQYEEGSRKSSSSV